ncbi:MAG: hypothetical protein M1827_001199 [Pycnora praestabilis]|nr:MAG: hypothetical protein M1827_001199 [Pycnora praestabilis]
MVKERSFNPAQAQRKIEKQKALKKGKAEVAARRNERLARRNPDRLQRQVDDLRSAEALGQALNSRERKNLEDLEKDLRAVTRARESLGQQIPHSTGGQKIGRRGTGVLVRAGLGGGGSLGKRRRGEDGTSNETETDEDIKKIPMPKDTPPPVPAQYAEQGNRRNVNQIPLGDKRLESVTPQALSTRITYEAAPVVRDLRKEAISAFTPNAVQRKIVKKNGAGRLLEPEELDKLKSEDYEYKVQIAGGLWEPAFALSVAAENEEGDDDTSVGLEEGQDKFRQELRDIEIKHAEGKKGLSGGGL